MAKSFIGLDIGAANVKMIEIKKTRGHFQLKNFGIAPLPPQTIVENSIMNPGAVVEAIRKLITMTEGKIKEAAIGVKGHSVIIKRISMPSMSKLELERNIEQEAEQYIPFDIADVNLDVQILSSGAEAGNMDVLLVAAKKDMIYDFTSVVGEAGIDAAVVDVDAFALANAFEINYSVSPNETVALMDIGAATTKIVILSGRAPQFTRDINMGGNQFTEELQKQLGLKYEEAETLKLGGVGERAAESVIPQEVERIIQEVGESLAQEIRRSLEFFTATSHEGDISNIYLSGGGSKVSSLIKIIESRTGIPVNIIDPFKNIEIDDRLFDINFLRTSAPMATVAVGLGLRRFDE